MHILDKTILEIHEALRNKETTPLELTKEALRRAHDDSNNAFEYICDEEALKFAAELNYFEEDNILFGIPYVLKDNFSTKNIPTTGSSNILNGYVPLFDATVVNKLRDKKCVLIGKTTLDELAMGGTGTTGHLGITNNPHSILKDRFCGGSSCGSAAAVAASIVPFSIGSDTGDSVRKPASYVGLVGFKPTWGRISRFGLFPFAPSMDHVAYFTRSVEDSAIILGALAGRDNNDFTSSFNTVDNYYMDIKTPEHATIGVIDEVLSTLSDKEVVAKYESLLRKLENYGYTIKHLHMNTSLLEAILPTYFVISCSEAGSNNANLDGIKFGSRKNGESYEEIIKNTRTAGFSELIKRRFITGSFCLMSENQSELFIRAQKARRLISNAFNELLEECDGILLPSAPSIAPKFIDNANKLSNEYLIADNYLALGNFTGTPSITLPMGVKENMPFGVNLTCKKFNEKLLFNLSLKIESITGLKNFSVVTKEGK